MQNDLDSASCSQIPPSTSCLVSWTNGPTQFLMQMKHVRSPQPSQSANESRSDFFVGLRWQMWHGARHVFPFAAPSLTAAGERVRRRSASTLALLADGSGATFLGADRR